MRFRLGRHGGYSCLQNVGFYVSIHSYHVSVIREMCKRPNVSNLRAVVRENRGFLLKFGKCDLTDFDETLHIQSTLRINNFPEILDFLA